ncbi:MAG: glycoside hydrolase family 2 [Microbacteriaceae bacterium]|nr:glycoside hydrolase family 2 [Microbacteriaceae bacterium]
MQTNADSVETTDVRASQQDGTYPRPQLTRQAWADLCGTWEFAYDDSNEGLDSGWPQRETFERSIVVPFPPESPASGIGDPGFHPVVWYRRDIDADDLSAAGFGSQGDRLILHFGAVDYRASVWLNGTFLGSHEGGHTPFSFDATAAIDPSLTNQSLVVRAEDDPFDVGQPRGKQDWKLEPHAIWYHRTTGIWQPVWLEAVPSLAIEKLHWTPDIPAHSVRVAVRLSRRPPAGTSLRIELAWEGEILAEVVARVDSDRFESSITIGRQANGQDYEHLLWSPEHPRLLDAIVTLSSASGHTDVVGSYLGLRSAAVDRGHFLLNDRPYYVRSVLNQGYWPESHLASPSADALRAEAQLIKDLGFNATRVHQKIEDPRFLFWTDKLGLLVWGETPGAYEFSTTAVNRMIAEWTAAIERDHSHPSIVTWVPLNESWGVQHIAHNQAIRDYSRTLFHLTKTLDPSRPVVSNDGWEHLDSDLWTIHDYEAAGEVMRARYADAESVAELVAGMGPAGRRIRLSNEPDRGQPVMLTEFGGIKYSMGAADDAWGYSNATSAQDFGTRLRDLLPAVHDSGVLAGFCYTQLTDTLQEANGLTTDDRKPKLPIEELRAIIMGDHER